MSRRLAIGGAGGAYALTVHEDASLQIILNHILESEVRKLNMASQPVITGNLVSVFKSRAEAAKTKAAAANARANSALDGIEAAVGQMDEVAKRMEEEAAELQAALGQHTNGAPE